MSDLPIGLAGSSLGPQNLGELWPMGLIFKTLSLDFHTCILYSIYKPSVIFFTQAVALHFRILQNFKHSHHSCLYSS